MWSSTNIFICNMALSDLAICIFAIPITPLTAFTGIQLKVQVSARRDIQLTQVQRLQLLDY
jgi:hypothetical protein